LGQYLLNVVRAVPGEERIGIPFATCILKNRGKARILVARHPQPEHPKIAVLKSPVLTNFFVECAPLEGAQKPPPDAHGQVSQRANFSSVRVEADYIPEQKWRPVRWLLKEEQVAERR
jgi:hypothetical protein